MIRRAIPIVLLACCLLASCSSHAPPTWRSRATSLVDDLGRQAAPKLFPQEYQNLLETFEHGEAVLYVKKNDKAADFYYLLVLQKGAVLREELKRLKERQLAEERRLAAELAARAEEERLAREAAEAVERQRIQEQLRVAEEAVADKPAPPTREIPPPQPPAYTVRRGETLPQIAGRNEIYNDSSLWPLIYWANRDQIRDPKQLWPGQIFRIPRHFTRDEAVAAKRFSAKK